MSNEPNEKEINVHIRWMIRRDMPEVLEIEKTSFEFPWSEEDFIRCLRQRDCIGTVAEYDDRVLGFMIYELHKNHIHVLDFAVRPDVRRRGIGSQMVQKLKGKLSQQRLKRVILEIRETNLDALKFFKVSGFVATDINRNFYNETDEDAIVMTYHFGKSKLPFVAANARVK